MLTKQKRVYGKDILKLHVYRRNKNTNKQILANLLLVCRYRDMVRLLTALSLSVRFY